MGTSARKKHVRVEHYEIDTIMVERVTMTYVNGKYQGDGFFQVSSHYKVQHRGDDGPRGLIAYTQEVLVKGWVCVYWIGCELYFPTQD